MRLFVALEPPDRMLDEVEAVVAPYRLSHPALRWTRREGWHITLSFLGEVGEERLGSLAAKLGRAASRHSPMELSFASAGAFPRAGRARVLWIGMDGECAALERLAGSVATAARQAGVEQEKRRFSPHLTLARCPQPTDLRPLVENLSGYAGQSWRADTIQLVRSYLGPRPRYETVQSWALGQG